MKTSRTRLIAFLGICLLALIGISVFGNRYATAFGVIGVKAHHYLLQPLFTLGGLPVTLLFLVKGVIFLVALILVAHFTLLLLQKRVLPHTPLKSRPAIRNCPSDLIRCFRTWAGGRPGVAGP